MSTYNKLSEFISQKMQMQHVYQPIMLMELLKHGGQATEEQIARIYLSLDPTQQKYYENKVRNMVGKVLKENGITTSQVHNRNDLNTCISGFKCDLPNITELENIKSLEIIL